MLVATFNDSIYFTMCYIYLFVFVFDFQLLFFNTAQRVINGVGWLDDRHGPSWILRDTRVYMNQIFCHGVHLFWFPLTIGFRIAQRRPSQGGQRGHGPPKCLEHIVILCFERRFSKQNSVLRQKIKDFASAKIFGLATPLLRNDSQYCLSNSWA